MKHYLTLMLILACCDALAQPAIKTTFVSGSGRSRAEGPAMVCDGNTLTKWCIDQPNLMPYSVTLDAGQATTFAEYGFTTGDDTSSYPSRNPVTWTLSGSNDGKEWTVLDSRKNDRSLPDVDHQECRFRPTAASASKAYRYFRFEFSKMRGGTRIQLSEISFYKTIQKALPISFVSGTGRIAKEGPAMTCDGHLYTKWCLDEPREMPYTVVFDASQATEISSYGLTTGDDTHTYFTRNPIDWRVSGSNDKQNWTVIDNRKYDRRMRDENLKEYRYKPSAPGSFRYYRFEFIRMEGGTRLQLSEIKLYN